jgi:hypothetical protein
MVSPQDLTRRARVVSTPVTSRTRRAHAGQTSGPARCGARRQCRSRSAARPSTLQASATCVSALRPSSTLECTHIVEPGRVVDNVRIGRVVRDPRAVHDVVQRLRDAVHQAHARRRQSPHERGRKQEAHPRGVLVGRAVHHRVFIRARRALGPVPRLVEHVPPEDARVPRIRGRAEVTEAPGDGGKTEEGVGVCA